MSIREKGTRRGLALLAVLWTLTLLSVIAASFTTQTRSDVDRARNAAANAQAEALADAGVYRAMHELLRSDDEETWDADGAVHEFEFAGGLVRVTVFDEGAKIDLNDAPDDLLHGLFVVAGLDEDEADAFVDAVVDFRDTDDLRRLHGAEDDDYVAAGLEHDAKDRRFEAVEELMQVLGMTAGLYDRVAPHLTVHSQNATVDPATAAREVLLAVPGADEAAIDAYLQSRINTAPADRGIPALPGAGAILSTNSPGAVFTIVAEGRPSQGGVFVRKAIVSLEPRNTPPYTFRSWQRGGATDLLPPAPALE